MITPLSRSTVGLAGHDSCDTVPEFRPSGWGNPRIMINSLHPENPHDPAAVCALFRDCASADKAWSLAATHGYGVEQISIVVSEGTRRQDAAAQLSSNPGSAGTGLGGAIESAVTGIASVVGAIGTSFLIPDFGLVVSGPLAKAISQAQEGRALDAVLAGIKTMGIPSGKLSVVEEHVHRGGVVLILRPATREDGRVIAEGWRTSAMDVI